MKIAELYKFVNDTDIAKNKDAEKREHIATLGLVSEIGSVLSALKKDILEDSQSENEIGKYLIRGELKEEIGDAIWYAVMLAQCLDDPRSKDIFSADIRTLQRQHKSTSRHDRRVQQGLGEARRTDFLKAAKKYLKKCSPTVDDYQDTAYNTRRTQENILLNVCAVVLQQLASQLSYDFLPDIEMSLNHEVRPKDPVDALGEALWHLSALASLYELKLSEVIALTKKKAEFRNPQKIPGPRYNDPERGEPTFPERFEVHFVPQYDSSTKMYWIEDRKCKKQLGAALTDNNYAGDGYRFHDVMHIAFAAYLGWSPNLRSFMGLKRRDDKTKDEIEDGGRAKILEEALILQIHQHAKNLVKGANLPEGSSPYGHDHALSFEYLRHLHEFTEGHEVSHNPKQDWEQAIQVGYDCFYKLKREGGGVIVVDMAAPKIEFKKFTEENRVDCSCPELGPDQDKCRERIP